MQQTIILIAICSSLASAAAALSTTADGSFQAIAQGPGEIAVYWRHEGRPASIYCDGELVGVFPPNAERSFACATVRSLRPNTTYTFALAESGPAISERTWAEVPSQAEYDLLVIGGTASGVAAAVSGAKLGLKVALVESTNRLGGMSSNGLGAADIRDQSCASGFFQEFREQVIGFYGGGTGLKFEPRVANAIIKSMVYEQSRITPYLKTTAIRPILARNRVCGAEVCGAVSGKTGRILAGVTIDATDTADFAAACGVEWRAGREPISPGEPHAGEIYFDDPEQTVLPGSTGAGDTKMQSYAYLMVWKDYGEKGAPPIHKPEHYDPASFAHSPDWDSTWNATCGILPNGKFEINQHPFGIDWPGINYDYPIATEQRRQEIEGLYRDRALGYLYFMQQERGHKNLGLADDEFVDGGNFPTSLYVREARRVMGEHVLTEDQVTFARQRFRAESIAIGDYPMDSHATEQLKDPNRRDKGEGEMWLTSFTPWHQIPYGVIVPKRVEGLLVTTAVSATHVAYGTLRMEAVRMSMGQAAGVAAYYAITRNLSLRHINPAWIQDKILSEHAYISWNSDVTPNTRHFKAINFLGARGVFREDAFRPDTHLTEEEALDALDRTLELEGCRSPLHRQAIRASESITRGQFAVLLVEAKQKIDHAWKAMPARQSYVDVPPDSPYHAAFEALAAHRITSTLFEEQKADLFEPNAPITRADAAQAIYLAHRDYAMNHAGS